jgi:predicted outer membrane repeat protein
MKNKKHTAAFFNLPAGICFALLCAVAFSTQANIITVTNTLDSGPGSLRQALADAQDGDTINFDPSVTFVTLTTTELVITKSITISASPQTVTVQRASQAPQFRIFHVMPGHSVEIDGLTILGGHITDDNGGGILNDNSTLTIAHCTVNQNAIVSGSVANTSGGGIYNSGTMTLNQVIVNNNNASFSGGGTNPPSGGGISNTGTMIIIAGTVQSNMGFWSAGGIYNSNTGMMTITGSTISNNQTGNPGHFGGSGGGIVNYGTMTIQDSTISGNRATGGDFEGYGGGIYGNNNTITNSTITGNSAVRGGGVAGGGNIAHTTFSNNSASLAGGALYVTSSLELGNTILKTGASGVNIFNNGGSLITHGYNISSDDGSGFLNGPGDQINTDPMLGPLQDNGGPTFTHALLPGSPAIDAGDPNFTPPPYYDQRGPDFLRVRNGRIDVGSFEVQAGSAPTPTPTPTASPTPTGTPTCTPRPLWYNGDFNGVNGLANEQNTAVEQSSVYDDFIVPSPGWHVTSVFSDNLLVNTTVTGATWEIRSGVSEGNGGTVVASGMTTTPVVTPTGRHSFNFDEFMIEVTGLSVDLAPGTYWLNVTPIGNGTGRSFNSDTSGTNCVGLPCGNDDNAFINSTTFGFVFHNTSSGDIGQPDFSMGVNGTAGCGTPSPTPTATATATATPTSTATPTPTATATATATFTPTPTPTTTPRPTPTPRPHGTPRGRPTPPPRP